MSDTIKFTDPAKGLVTYNIDSKVSTKKFLSYCEEQKLKFLKAAEIRKDDDKACGYTYEVLIVKDMWYKENGWAYLVDVNDNPVKIGMTETTLNSRFSSYSAGTRENRKKGTCSVTNFYCSEFFREALNSGASVNIYALKVPASYTPHTIFNETIQALNKHAYLYESALLSKYKELYGTSPILCNNTSKCQ